MGLDNSVSMWASQERRLLMFLSNCCTATRVSLSFFTLEVTGGQRGSGRIETSEIYSKPFK